MDAFNFFFKLIKKKKKTFFLLLIPLSKTGERTAAAQNPALGKLLKKNALLLQYSI